MSSIINVGVGLLYIAPPGTDHDDPTEWQVLGTTIGPIDLVLDESEPPPMAWPPVPRTITFTTRLTWYGHWVLFRRAHPRARRVKIAYHRRRR